MEHILNSSFPLNSFNYPWQLEKPAAFFQDPPGGSIWHPRSYNCSFCKREFRSAQALGGHMNVHRRDRARQKQSPIRPQAEAKGRYSYQEASTPAAKFALPGENPVVCEELGEPFMNSEEILGNPDTRRSDKRDDDDDDDDDFVETKLSVGINLVGGGTFKCKRYKKSGVSPLPFLHSNLCSSDGYSASSIEDIDLELRLGDPPAVK